MFCFVKLKKRKQKNSRYSLRGFANFLDIAPSTLSRILTNSQELSVSATKKIMKKLALLDDEKFLFIASVAEEKKIRTLLSLALLSSDTNKDFKFTLESVTNLAMKQFSDGCIIHLTNSREESILHAKHKYGHFDKNRFSMLSAPMICHPILSPDCPVFIDLKGEHSELLEHLNASSLLCVPVMKGEKKYGAITFLRTNSRKGFGQEDLIHAMDFSSKTAYVYDLLSEV
jgi:transcriptional regulator with XRE-family HTH domain